LYIRSIDLALAWAAIELPQGLASRIDFGQMEVLVEVSGVDIP
jgi:hypothetical protein